jgi:hypothetical protein
MEDILDVYPREGDKQRPLVCMDECPKQLLGKVRRPLAADKGKSARYDTEYVRKGTCELFKVVDPLEGWRRVSVREQRTRRDWGQGIKQLVDADFPGAEKTLLEMDNLNTHALSSVYEMFPPVEAKRIRDKLEIHYTPKQGSWLNMAEIEIHVLVNHGLSKRMSRLRQMEQEVKVWNTARNKAVNKINWRFTTKDARIKLHRLIHYFKSDTILGHSAALHSHAVAPAQFVGLTNWRIQPERYAKCGT